MEKYWLCVGKSGFKVFRFALRRCPNQAPPPWVTDKRKKTEEKEESNKSEEGKEKQEDGEEESADKENRDKSLNSPPPASISTSE